MIKEMAQIPYIAHLARMHKAYKRELELEEKNKRLKLLLKITNIIWGVIVGMLCGIIFLR